MALRESLVELVKIKLGMNGRSDLGSDEELRLLGASLGEQQLQNIWLTEGFELLIGYRRFHAAKKVGLKALRATITDEEPTPAKVRWWQLTEDCQRKDWKIADRAKCAIELMKLNPKWQAKDLAAHLHYDQSTICRLLSVERLIPVCRESFDSGAMNLSVAYSLSQLPAEEQHAAFRDAVDNKLTREEVVHRIRRRHAPAETKVKRVSIPLPNGVTVTVAGPELGFDDALDSCAEVVKRGRKAQGQNHSLATFAKAMADEAKGKQQ